MSNINTPVNPFKKGNQYHKLATHTGRPKRYTTPDELWKAATDYFTWCTTTPVIVYRSRRGKLVPVFKNREMSLKDLYKWLGICNLCYYKKLPDFTRKVGRIHNVINWYNYVQAAAGFIKGRSVGHALRKEHHSDTPKKACVDTRKVRITKQKIYITLPSPLEIPIAIYRVPTSLPELI